MTDITDIDTTYNISSIMDNYDNIKYNPAAIVGTVLDFLSNVTNGKVTVLDPTNPFVMLLESSAVNTAAAMIESQILLRKQYPILAQTEEDLYRHMSDKDYIDRFSTPSSTKFSLVIEYNSLYNNAVKVENTTYSMVTIPRDTIFRAEDVEFTMQYPIDIKLYDSGNVVVTYDATITSPIQSLSTNIISSEIKKMSDGTKCLCFDVELLQYSIKTVSAAIDNSTPFTKTISYDDKYYYCRIFYKSNSTNNAWKEIKTTHTDQIYDVNTPTAVLQVMDGKLKVDIPLVYTDQGLINGAMRIDIYTTKGSLYLNLKDYSLSSFTSKLVAIDEARDSNNYTIAMSKCNFYLYCSNVVSGGYDGISFEDLKSRVINNSIGDPNIPITNIQLVDSKIVEGFEISKNIDSITNRIYVISKQLPTPSNVKLITPATVTINTIFTDLNALRVLSGCYDNTDRITISSDIAFKDNNGNITIMDKKEVEKFKELDSLELVELVNNTKYYYTPFYYVVDNTSDTFSMRAYYLDNPTMYSVNFVNHNTSMEATVNTDTYTIVKHEVGYTIMFVTTSDERYRSIPDTSVSMVLSFVPYGENSPVYIKGVYQGFTDDDRVNGERVFTFEIKSNFDIDSEDNIYITNASVDINSYETVPVELSTKFTFYYCTNAIPVDIEKSDMDESFPSWLFTKGEWLPITQEEINISFGKRLKNLWTQTKSIVTTNSYEKYKEDVPLRYTEDVYEYGEDGTIITVDEDGDVGFTVLHEKGDIVYDDNGEIIYKYRKGDTKLDENGSPVVSSDEYVSRTLDILMVDGAYLFATDLSYEDYRSEICNTLVTWITESLSDIDENLLEQTHIYYRPKYSLGDVNVNIGNNKIVTIPAEQSFKITLYVEDSVYKDNNLRSEIETKIVTYINTFLDTDRINMNDLIQGIKNICGSSVITLSMTGLGGDNNYQTVTLENDTSRLCLKKELVLQSDGLMLVKEAVEFNYVKYTSNYLN